MQYVLNIKYTFVQVQVSPLLRINNASHFHSDFFYFFSPNTGTLCPLSSAAVAKALQIISGLAEESERKERKLCL